MNFILVFASIYIPYNWRKGVCVNLVIALYVLWSFISYIHHKFYMFDLLHPSSFYVFSLLSFLRVFFFFVVSNIETIAYC